MPPRDDEAVGDTAYDLFVSYADGDRDWVEGYLFDALDRAGVRYISEAAFELGAPRLSELERAIRASRRTLLVISPAYLADDYAPFNDLLAQTYGLETGSWPVIPLVLTATDLPTRLAVLTGLDATSPPQWAPAIDQLCVSLSRPVPTVGVRPSCPYPGLLPFGEADAARFFGRDAEVIEMVQRLRLHPFLAVIGASGTGKSSLVFAGLIPALRRSSLFGPGEWAVVAMRPGAHPLAALDRAVGDHGSPGGRRLVLVCDQFEESFTLGRQQAAAFHERLGELARRDGNCVVLTVRADFYADVMATSLWDEIRAHRLEVAPLDENGLRSAIVRPAAEVGVHIDPALVERLVADAAGEPGVLPLVQETLVLLWERLERRFLPVDAHTSLTVGDGVSPAPHSGLQAAMARRADATLADLSSTRQLVARRIFVRLVQFGQGRADTRRQQRIADLRVAGDDPAEFDATLAHLVDHRLLTTSGGDDGTDRRIDLAHEALIAGWPTFREWLVERREAEQTRRQLEAKAHEWIRLGRGKGGLLDEIEMAEAERWLAGADAAELGVDPALADLVTVSRQSLDQARRAGRRRTRAIVGALAIGLLIVGALAVWGVISARTAEDRRREAEDLARASLSRQLAAQAVSQLDRDLDRALLLAARAYRTEPTTQATSSLLATLGLSPQLMRFVSHGGDEVTEVTFTTGSNLIASIDYDGTLILRQPGTGEQAGEATALGGDGEFLLLTAEFSPDGRFVAVDDCSSGTACTITIREVATGAPAAAPFVLPTSYVTAMAFDPAGNVLAIGTGVFEEASIVMWDITAGRQIGDAMPTRTQSLAFSRDGRLLASGLPVVSTAAGEAGVSLWDVATQELLAETPIYVAGGVNALDFSPDGAVLAAGHGHGSIKLYSTVDLTEVTAALPGPRDLTDLQFSPDGALLASVHLDDAQVRLWSLADPGAPRLLPGHQGAVNSVAFDASGSQLVTGADDGGVIVWDNGGHTLLASTRQVHDGGVSSIAVGADAVVTVGRGESPDGIQPGVPEIRRWSPALDESIGPPIPAAGVVALSPDGRVAAIGDTNGAIHLVETASGRERGAPIAAHPSTITAIAFSDDGGTIVSAGCAQSQPEGSGCEESKVRLWDVDSSRPIGGGPLSGAHLALSPDETVLAAASSSIDTVLWNVARNREYANLPAKDRIGGIAFSPDGRLLAVAGQFGGAKLPTASQRTLNNVTLWDVAQRRPVGEPLLGHVGGVTAVAFNPDGTILASGDFDGELRLWDVASSEPLGGPIDAGASVDVLRFGADGRTLASGHADGQVMLWDTDVESWLDRACTIANRDLDGDEWTRFVGADVPYEPTCP